MEKFKTHEEFAQELGISRKKLYLALKENNYETKGRLLSPKQQKEIKELLGFST